MPCDTVSTARIKLDVKTTDRAALKAAIDSVSSELDVAIRQSEGKDGSITLNISSYSGSIDEAEIKSKVSMAYSRNVVKAQAKRFGWTVKDQPNGTMTVIKARF